MNAEKIMSNKVAVPNGFIKDSIIIPTVTLSIPMPEGAATPAEPRVTPTQSSPSAPPQTEQRSQ